MKTRSSSGVGQKVDLEFDLETLRIRDLEEDEESQMKRPNINIISNAINKPSSVVRPAVQPEVKVEGNTNSTALKQMLANIKKT